MQLKSLLSSYSSVYLELWVWFSRLSNHHFELSWGLACEFYILPATNTISISSSVWAETLPKRDWKTLFELCSFQRLSHTTHRCLMKIISKLSFSFVISIRDFPLFRFIEDIVRLIWISSARSLVRSHFKLLFIVHIRMLKTIKQWEMK